MQRAIEADYLVVGAGAMGLAFTDTWSVRSDATVVVVDRNDQPGGHWTTAYPFVRLHQPSAYYGVNSRDLGSDTIDQGGLNAGYYELASGAEVCAYFDAVMRQHLLPTGRVTYLPMSEYLGDGRVRTLGGDEIEVSARRVVTSHVEIIVPSMRPPSYAVAPGVDCVPPNDLPRIRDARDRYVIVGAGKTAMDACLWLLRHGIAAAAADVDQTPRLVGVGPRRDSARFAVRESGCCATSRTSSPRCTRPNRCRICSTGWRRRAACCASTQSVDPTMYRCAILSHAELEELRRIEDVVRMGHVQSIEPGRVTLDGGTLDIDGSALYIDCTADGLAHREPTTVFSGDHISLQTVRTCQPAFSAAVIAHVEAAYPDDDTRNAFCGPVPYPREPTDWLRMMLAFNKNQLQWFSDPDMMAWVDAARLNVLHHVSAACQRAGARENHLGADFAAPRHQR